MGLSDECLLWSFKSWATCTIYSLGAEKCNYSHEEMSLVDVGIIRGVASKWADIRERLQRTNISRSIQFEAYARL